MTPPVMTTQWGSSFSSRHKALIRSVPETAFHLGFLVLMAIGLFFGLGSFAHGAQSTLSDLESKSERESITSDAFSSPAAATVGERLPEFVIAKLSAESRSAAIAGNNAWIMICSALVLFMIAPGSLCFMLAWFARRMF